MGVRESWDYTPHHWCEQHILRGNQELILIRVTQHLNPVFEVTTGDLTDRFSLS